MNYRDKLELLLTSFKAVCSRRVVYVSIGIIALGVLLVLTGI